MKKYLLALIGPWLLSGCGVLQPADANTPQILSAAEVRALFVEHTVRSYNLKTKVSTWSYYRKDGHLAQERFWEHRTGRWRITADGQICLNVKRESCRFIGRIGDRIYKYKPDSTGRLKAIIRYYDFVEGNTLKL